VNGSRGETNDVYAPSAGASTEIDVTQTRM
jgi:hypothetical protein